MNDSTLNDFMIKHETTKSPGFTEYRPLSFTYQDGDDTGDETGIKVYEQAHGNSSLMRK